MVNAGHSFISGYDLTLFAYNPCAPCDFKNIAETEHCVWSPAGKYLVKGVP